jgi:hypothetical protein
MSKISKAYQKPTKRRRPSKKLNISLESLADALPDNGEVDGEGITAGDAKIRHKSLTSRPGAMKRKHKLERIEKERFGKNMAEMATMPAPVSESFDSSTPAATQPTTSDRWAALRSFISQTMEQKPEFRSVPSAKPLS